LKQIVKNIFIILDQREKKKLIQIIVLDIFISLLDIAFLAMLLWVIQFYSQKDHSFSVSFFSNNLLNEYPLLLIIFFFIGFSLKNFFGYYVSRMQLKFVYDVASRLSQKNMMKYLDGTYTDFVNIDSSVQIRKISQQPIEFGHYVLGGFQQIISQAILIGITIIAILMYSPSLFGLLFIILAPPIIFTGIVLKKKLNGIRKTAKPVSEKTIQYLKEALSGFIESNIYHSKTFFSKRYHASQAKFNDFLSEQQVMQNMPSKLIEVFAILGLLILIGINSFAAHTNPVQIITIGAFMAGAYKIIPGIVKILNATGYIKTYEFTIHDLLQSKELSLVEKEINNSTLKSISFKNILFNYKDETVLKNFSLTISKGDFIGLSGISGKGKTTVINLLLGFLEPNRGSILLNDACKNSRERQQYWNRIAYVKQQPLLIYDSILKNITLNDDAVDLQKLEMIMRITGLTELIANYPEGLNKIITENGKNLSGGQRQRIAIARALYKEFDLIILDEPFSELDRSSENYLLHYLNELANAGKMILLITHSAESLSFCNNIIYLDEKRSARFSDIDARLS
jgi:ABC-type multidrug transport system fused ATPase/permease subunit